MVLPLVLTPCLGAPLFPILALGQVGPPLALDSVVQRSAIGVVPAAPVRLVLGDVDGDGLQDALALGADGSFVLLRNRGDEGYRDVTVASGLGGVEFATCALLVDLDADGALDLFLGSWTQRVWRNLGDGTFTPLRPGIDHDGIDLLATAVDTDADGLVDLHLVTEAGDVLYRNMGAGGFSAVQMPGVAWAARPGATPAPATVGDDAQAGPSARQRLTRWRALTARGASGGGTASASSGFTATPTGMAAPLAGVGICADTIVDQATGTCIEATSNPALGKLYPLSDDFNVTSSGLIGIGTTLPDADVTIGNVGSIDGHKILSFSEGPNGPFAFTSGFSGSAGNNYVGFSFGAREIMTWKGSGAVGINTNDPRAAFELRSNPTQDAHFRLLGESPELILAEDDTGHNFRIRVDGVTFSVSDGIQNVDRLTIDPSGLVSVKQSLEIRGGADIVERFETAEGAEPGTVVVIDPENPGELLPSSEAYDSKVAGVVSGAGGVHPGLCLSQEGALDGETLVAMNGRVYVKATASNGAIRPGDLLTTASLPGHAMKATDHGRAFGSVIGKAMSSLESGEGLVLVLVNLQ